MSKLASVEMVGAAPTISAQANLDIAASHLRACTLDSPASMISARH